MLATVNLHYLLDWNASHLGGRRTCVAQALMLIVGCGAIIVEEIWNKDGEQIQPR